MPVKARYNRKLKEASKVAQANEKEWKRRAREHVQIGPLPMAGNLMP